VLVFSKGRCVYDRDDVIVVVANLEPDHTRDTWIHLNMPELCLDWHDRFVAHDLITGARWNWAEHNFIRLGPDTEPVHIVHVRTDGPSASP
jgi:starch synthase (maltosyl-transferring)